ncbi:hypothetical protein JQ615_01085 [Bradyrhizobium jicamae]|uniref:Uncharacterized protein n=1 Tax=Bradyrhizobium jicamae TaxID=280332 RepID=A0ABS5FB09_9BRAD|nr:hypothetical protein [Bradyrhizobium jicamae]MBR0793975.1 hypothetical protein [Bradyrhizobium jicamae]
MGDPAQFGIELTSTGVDATNAKHDTFSSGGNSAGQTADTLQAKTTTTLPHDAQEFAAWRFPER